MLPRMKPILMAAGLDIGEEKDFTASSGWEGGTGEGRGGKGKGGKGKGKEGREEEGRAAGTSLYII